MTEKRSITADDRTIEYLKKTVRSIYKAFLETSKKLSKKYPRTCRDLPREITFITSQELEDIYPDKTPEEREYLIAKKYKAIFIIGIGDKLKSGIVHGTRSPDYDDWSMDGDWIMYDERYDRAIELSSMGIRVSGKSLLEQLEKSGKMEKIKLPYHQSILKKELPYTIGGGIGMSRLIMYILGVYHISEIQASSRETSTLDQIKHIQYL